MCYHFMKLICSTHTPSTENDYFPTSLMVFSWNSQSSLDYKLTMLLLEKLGFPDTDGLTKICYMLYQETNTWKGSSQDHHLCQAFELQSCNIIWLGWVVKDPITHNATVASHLPEKIIHHYVTFSCVVGMNISSLTHIVGFWDEGPWVSLLIAFWDEKCILRCSDLSCLVLFYGKISFYEGNESKFA